MNKFFPKFILLLIIVCFVGCGYTTKSLLPSRFKTIHVEPFDNNVEYTTESSRSRNIYIPLLEVDVRKAIIDRFLFDGNLKIADDDKANLTMKGTLLNYEKSALRYDDSDDVEEYRIHVVVDFIITDVEKDEVFIEEYGFAGEATYFVSGPSAKSEAAAVDEAVKDLGQRVVERIIENW